MHSGYVMFCVGKEEENENIITVYTEKIKKYDSSYQTPTIKTPTSSSGCYVATAVYGSYNCPEVWVLRRFRDYVLAKTFYGRLFIKLYYTISPIIVKIFGKTEWFKNMCRIPLGRLVSKLQRNDIKNTPYQDKQW